MHRILHTASRAGAVVAAVIGTAFATSGPALAGTPAAGMTNHFDPMPMVCGGVPVTIVAPDNNHGAGHVIEGGTGPRLMVSYTLPGEETVYVRPHAHQPTETCIQDLGSYGTVTLTVVTPGGH